MIFVTVGTHEQPFNRLVEYIDNLKENGLIDEDVIMQTGFSTYEPKFCEWKSLFPYSKMNDLVEQARIVITHGGPSSFIMSLQKGKIPIVVPRKKEFDEHVNNHQVEFSNAVAQKYGNIIVVEDIEKLQDTISNYEFTVSTMPANIRSNNDVFCTNFAKIVDDMFLD